MQPVLKAMQNMEMLPLQQYLVPPAGGTLAGAQHSTCMLCPWLLHARFDVAVGGRSLERRRSLCGRALQAAQPCEAFLPGPAGSATEMEPPPYLSSAGCRSFDLSMIVDASRAADLSPSTAAALRRQLAQVDVLRPGAFPAAALAQLTTLDAGQIDSLKVRPHVGGCSVSSRSAGTWSASTRGVHGRLTFKEEGNVELFIADWGSEGRVWGRPRAAAGTRRRRQTLEQRCRHSECMLRLRRESHPDAHPHTLQRRHVAAGGLNRASLVR